MKGIPNSSVISFSLPAVSIASDSLSTTQGPAIRNNGRSGPTVKSHNCILQLRETRIVEFVGGADESGKQRGAIARIGGEFRMKLAGDEPGMFGQLDNLHQLAVY